MSNRMLNWRILLAVFIAATLALAPAIAEARAGSSAGGARRVWEAADRAPSRTMARSR